MTGEVKSVSIQCEDFVNKHDVFAQLSAQSRNAMFGCAGASRTGLPHGLVFTRGEFLQVLTITFLLQFFLWNEAQ